MFFKNPMSAEDTSRLRVFASHSKDWTVQQCPMLLQPPMINEIASVSFLLRTRRLQREKARLSLMVACFAFEGGATVAKTISTFKTLDEAIILRVLSLSPMEFTI